MNKKTEYFLVAILIILIIGIIIYNMVGTKKDEYKITAPAPVTVTQSPPAEKPVSSSVNPFSATTSNPLKTVDTNPLKKVKTNPFE